MEKGQKFNSLYDKVADYQKRKLLITTKKREKDKQGKYTKEYKTLLKAKKDIVDKAKNSIDGALTFSEIISYGELSKDARGQWTRTSELSKDPRLTNYIFRDKKEEIKQLLHHQREEFVMDVFNDKIIERLLNNIFFHGLSKKAIEKIQLTKNEKFKNYRIDIAKKMLRKSISELKQYLPIEWNEFLIPKLDEAMAICDIINTNQKEIYHKRIRKQIIKSRYQR